MQQLSKLLWLKTTYPIIRLKLLINLVNETTIIQFLNLLSEVKYAIPIQNKNIKM